MGKLIALILSVLMMLAGIVLVGFGSGIGLLMLVVGMLGTVMMGIITSARGSFVDIFTPRGFYDTFVKDKVDQPDKDQTTNIWDQLSRKKEK